MKYLMLIFVVVFASCTKQTIEQPAPQEEIATRVSRDVFTHVGVRTEWPPYFIPYFKGVAFEAKVVDLKMQGDYTKSIWISFYYRYLVNGEWQRDWIQLGWYQLSQSGGPELAFYVYHISGPLGYGQAQVDIHLVADGSVTVQKGVVTRFEMKNIEGSTRWNIALNGKVKFDIDLHTDVAGDFPNEISSNNAIALFTETRGGNTFSSVIHVNYLEYYKDGVWIKSPTARSSGSGWKVVGHLQNPAFQNSEFEIGGRGFTESETLLW